MKKSLFIAAIVLLFTSFISEELFTGKIIYKNSFTDLEGNDISDKIAPYLGKEQHYFVHGNNYKALDENKNYVQLYNGATNTYYYFTKDKIAQKVDASTSTSENPKVTHLDKKEKIAGYDCKALQIDADEASTIYFYSPKVKVDPKGFAKHNFGEFNKFMEASQGALPLKFIVTDNKNGYIWTSTATEVSKMKLSPKDFEFPSGYQLKK